MCILTLAKPEAKKLPEATLRDMWTTNPDGCGMAFVANGKLHVFKALKLRNALQLYRKAYRTKDASSPVLLHMRQATHGAVSLENAHPFFIGSDGATVLGHNGILSGFGSLKESDTREFCSLVFASRSSRNVFSPTLLRAIERAITPGNKFVLLRADRKYRIIGEPSGYWDANVWYSNRTWKRTCKTFLDWTKDEQRMPGERIREWNRELQEYYAKRDAERKEQGLIPWSEVLD